MGTDISLFSGYSQSENRTTNYCLLILKMLYEENPKFLGEVLSKLIGDERADVVGVSFRQQVRKEGSVPDGLIVQPAITVYIETKNYDWFYDSQLSMHLENLNRDASGMKALIALGNFEVLHDERFTNIERQCAEKFDGKIYFAAATFEDFVASFPAARVSKNLADAISDFTKYLDATGLLPKWKYRLDVVNCARNFAEVAAENVYICPQTGGAYSHARAKYFGLYKGMAVQRVALIEAVVDLGGKTDAQVLWRNVGTTDGELIDRAAEKGDLRPGGEPIRVFLLDKLHPTDFKKPGRAGMRTPKQYFDLERLRAIDAADLAAKLRGKFWDDALFDTASDG